MKKKLLIGMLLMAGALLASEDDGVIRDRECVIVYRWNGKDGRIRKALDYFNPASHKHIRWLKYEIQESLVKLKDINIKTITVATEDWVIKIDDPDAPSAGTRSDMASQKAADAMIDNRECVIAYSWNGKDGRIRKILTGFNFSIYSLENLKYKIMRSLFKPEEIIIKTITVITEDRAIKIDDPDAPSANTKPVTVSKMLEILEAHDKTETRQILDAVSRLSGIGD